MGAPPPADAIGSLTHPLPPLPGTVADLAASLASQVPVGAALGALQDASAFVLEAQAEIANALALVNKVATEAILVARLLLNPNFSLAAAFSFETPSFEICGFGIPKFTFAFAIDINFAFLFAFPPTFLFALQLPCGFALQVTLGPGGGRTSNPVPEFGAEFDVGLPF